VTFSIVACDLGEHAWGVAVASKFPAVGAVVPWVQADVGAVATQSFANTSYGPRGLALMATGLSAQESLTRLLEDDPERQLRQVGLVDTLGRAATFTGDGCFSWSGGLAGNGYAIQGNVLENENVIARMEAAFLGAKGDLASRLHASLVAGDRAGGDKRGRQSAALYVAKPNGGYGGHNDRWADYRVDDDEHPVRRLGELLELHRLYFGKSDEKDRVRLKGKNLDRVKAILMQQGYLSRRTTNGYDEASRAAFAVLIGNENFEERADPAAGWIDKPVLAYLFRKYEK